MAERIYDRFINANSHRRSYIREDLKLTTSDLVDITGRVHKQGSTIEQVERGILEIESGQGCDPRPWIDVVGSRKNEDDIVSQNRRFVNSTTPVEQDPDTCQNIENNWEKLSEHKNGDTTYKLFRTKEDSYIFQYQNDGSSKLSFRQMHFTRDEYEKLVRDFESQEDTAEIISTQANTDY